MSAFVFGTPTLTLQQGVAGFAQAVAFGTPVVSSAQPIAGLDCPAAFGTPGVVLEVTPGPIPIALGQGTGVNIAVATGTGLVTYPADVSVSDLAVLVGYTKNDAAGSIGPGTLANWTELYPPTGFSTTERMAAWYRVCDGTEDGANTLTVVATGTTGRRAAQVYTFRGTPGATWGFDVNAATTGPAVFKANAFSISASIAGISVSGNNRLLLNFIGLSNRELTAKVINNETGATFDADGAFIYDGGNNPTLEMHYASLTTSGSVSNGTFVCSATNAVAIIATGIWQTQGAPAAQLSVGATGLAAGVSFGEVPIASPQGVEQAAAFGGAGAGAPAGVGAAAVVQGAPVAVPGGVDAPAAFGVPTVLLPGAVLATGLAAGAAFGNVPIATPGGTVQAAGFGGAAAGVPPGFPIGIGLGALPMAVPGGFACAAAFGSPTILLGATAAQPSDAVRGSLDTIRRHMVELLAAIEEATKREELLQAKLRAVKKTKAKRRTRARVELSDERNDNERLGQLERLLVAIQDRTERLREELRLATAEAAARAVERDIRHFADENRAAIAQLDAAFESRLRLDDEEVILALM